MVLRRVIPQALMNENRVVLEGSENERLPLGQVYVSPTTRQVYDASKGDRLRNLPPDAREVPKTTWWSSQGDEATAKPWFETPEGIELLKREFQQMKKYFPKFDLFQDESGRLVWSGNIDGLGQATLTYPENYPEGVLVLDLGEQRSALSRDLAKRGRTPAEMLALLIHFEIAGEGKNEVVRERERKAETQG